MISCRLKQVIQLFIISLILIGCSKIPDKSVQKYASDYTFIITFTNLIYESHNTKIVIPIYKGHSGDVRYKDFHDYCVKNKLLESHVGESGFIIKTDKGQLKSTLHDFIRFYKKNILKDIDIEKPTWVGISDEWWYILYDFEVNKIPCYLKIEVNASNEDYENWNKDSKLTSPFQINPDESMKDPYFTYSFYINQKSTDKPGRFPGQ